jgi:hypothetical protein
VGELGVDIDSLKMVKTAFGGYWSLTFDVLGRRSIVEEWLEEGLGWGDVQ